MRTISVLTVAISIAAAAVAADIPSAIQWHEAPLPRPKSSRGTVVVKGLVVTAGGTYWKEGKKYWTAGVWVYNPQINQWDTLPDLPHYTGYPAAAAQGSTVYVVGGSGPTEKYADCFALDLDKDPLQWQTLPQLPDYRSVASAEVVQNTLYVIAGVRQPYTDNKTHSTVFALDLDDPEAGWRECAPLPGHSREGAMSAVCGGKLYLFGGGYSTEHGEYPPLRDSYYYTPETDQWTRIADLPYGPRWGAAAPYADRYIFITGGYTVSSYAEVKKHGRTWGFSRRVYVYDTQADSYTYLIRGRMPYGALDHGAACIGNRLYVLDGEYDIPPVGGSRGPWMLIGEITP